MPSLNGAELFTVAPLGGAAFNLNRASRRDGRLLVDNAEVELRRGSRVVVVRAPGMTTHDQAVSNALRAGQRGLDLLSVSGVDSVIIVDSEEARTVWWETPDGIVLRQRIVSPIEAPTLHATATVGDGTREVVPQPAFAPQWDESLRFYRLAQSTDDLFDAYRNLYLALESILSLLNPIPEAEGKWVKAALGAASKFVDLAGHVPAGTADPIDFLYHDLYLRHRNAVFHAKRFRPGQLPQETGATADLADSHQRGLFLYLAVVDAVLGLRGRRLQFSKRVTMAMNRIIFANASLAVSDVPTPTSPMDQDVLSGDIYRFDSVQVTEDDEVCLAAVRAVVSKMAPMRAISRILVLDGSGAVRAVEVLDNGPLQLDGIHAVEVELGSRLHNAGMPRVRFPY